jgi:hypothetical protein
MAILGSDSAVTCANVNTPFLFHFLVTLNVVFLKSVFIYFLTHAFHLVESNCKFFNHFYGQASRLEFNVFCVLLALVSCQVNH